MAQDSKNNMSFISTIFQVSQMISDSRDINKLFNLIINSVVDKMGAKTGSLMLYDAKIDCLYIAAAKGIPEEVIPTVKVKPGVGIAGTVFKEGLPKILIGEISKTNVRLNEKISSAISVPIRLRGQTLGVLNINRPESMEAYNDNDMQFAIFVVNQVAISLENARLHTEREERIAKLNKLNSDMEIASRELEENNKKLKELQSQLVQSEKMSSIGQLAAGIAHEINNPIGFIGSNITTLSGYLTDIKRLNTEYEAIFGYIKNGEGGEILENRIAKIEALKTEIDIPFVMQDMDKIIFESLDGINRVKKIVKDLKEFSHVDQTEIKEADINSSIESTINIIWNEIKYKASVKKEYGNIPAIKCYPQQLNQVFMNITINAVQAIKDKGEITIKTDLIKYEKITDAVVDGFVLVPLIKEEDLKKKGEFIRITISDNGEGISAENISKIFDPFFTTKAVGKGTGLGLSITFGIMKKHNGYIGVKSVVGQGTTFVVYIPKEPFFNYGNTK